MDSVALQKDDYLRQLEVAQKQLSNLQEKSADLSGREPLTTDRDSNLPVLAVTQLTKENAILQAYVNDKDHRIHELEDKAYYFESEFSRLKEFQGTSQEPEIEV